MASFVLKVENTVKLLVSFGHQIILLIYTIASILLLIKWHSKICLVLPSNLLEFNSLFTIQRFHCIVDFTSRYLTFMTFEVRNFVIEGVACQPPSS